jgi:peptidoglycan/LPS O-acetylase OafA/YrhL
MNSALLERRGLTNFLRLLAAIAVLFSHSYPISGAGPDPLIFKTAVGDLAVSIFFVLSGFFIYTSSNTHSIKNYLILRIARILPPLIFVNASIVLVIALFLNKKGGVLQYFSAEPSNPLIYLFRNSFLFGGLQPGISNTFKDLPFEYVVNGSLWTLPIEVKCYTLAMILSYFVKRCGKHFVLYASFTGILLLYWVELGTTLPVEEFISRSSLKLFVTFFSGAILTRVSLAHLVRSRFLFCFAPVSALLVFFNYQPLAPIAYSILIPCLAIIPMKLSRFFVSLNDRDYSFGFYLWSFPLQQLIMNFRAETTPLSLSILAFGLTMMAAVFSWTFIEKPSLKYARSSLLPE